MGLLPGESDEMARRGTTRGGPLNREAGLGFMVSSESMALDAIEDSAMMPSQITDEVAMGARARPD